MFYIGLHLDIVCIDSLGLNQTLHISEFHEASFFFCAHSRLNRMCACDVLVLVVRPTAYTYTGRLALNYTWVSTPLIGGATWG